MNQESTHGTRQRNLEPLIEPPAPLRESILVLVLAGYVESGALHYLMFMIPAAVMGLSQGMTISPNQTLTLRAVDPAYGGVAGSIISLGQRMGTAIGTARVATDAAVRAITASAIRPL